MRRILVCVFLLVLKGIFCQDDRFEGLWYTQVGLPKNNDISESNSVALIQKIKTNQYLIMINKWGMDGKIQFRFHGNGYISDDKLFMLNDQGEKKIVAMFSVYGKEKQVYLDIAWIDSELIGMYKKMEPK